jgi:hypothetical protein
MVHQGWPTSTHRRATSAALRPCLMAALVSTYIKGRNEFTRKLLLINKLG